MSDIALMMEAASTSKTSVNLYQTTWRNTPEDSHLHARRRENLKCRDYGNNTSSLCIAVSDYLILLKTLCVFSLQSCDDGTLLN
jgi:hypothetical protein